MSCMLRHRSFKSIRELHVLHNVDGINEQNASHRGMGENCYTMDVTLSMNRRKTIQRQHVSSKSSTKKKLSWHSMSKTIQSCQTYIVE